MSTHSTIDSFERASRHPILVDRPAPDFFSGALLGNGGLGAVVTARPDGVVIHFGHNNVWDIRLAEDNAEKLGKFEDVFARVKALWAAGKPLHDEKWYTDYMHMTAENYRKSYPRPFPCGSLLIGFDRRDVEVLGHRLDVSVGMCEVGLLVGGAARTIQIFTDMEADRLWLRAVDASGTPASIPIDRVRLIPDPETPKGFPKFTSDVDESRGTISFRQTLPKREFKEGETATEDAKDRAIRLSVRLAGPLQSQPRTSWSGKMKEVGPLERRVQPSGPFVACVQLDEGLSRDLPAAPPSLPAATLESFEQTRTRAENTWREFWSKSGVALEDEFLERVWYQNLYFLNCSVKPGVTCPGLWANWSYANIGSAWHGDYHMNYNTQQPFWVTFSANHVDKNLPYVDLVDHLMPISRKWAKEYYGLRGAYFPHSAYPVEMNLLPYPVPSWGWEICETPWSVQGLWWHFLYTQDKKFLTDRAFTPIREATLFVVDYMNRPDARDPKRFGDDRYHIFPTVPPELYGLADDWRHNADCLVDVTLTKFLFLAYLKSCEILNRTSGEEAALIAQVRDILAHFPDYPTAAAEKIGGKRVFVTTPIEHPETVYNTPDSTMTVFPGEDHGLHSPPDQFEIAANSYRVQQNEGGNDLVFLNLQGARLGLLDLEKFKRQIRYCMLLNGACTDLILQVHGRYVDTLPYDFMGRMGIWFENFALPAVINECLLQSYNGELRFFANWPKDQSAEFRTLRAAGAFLVSASIKDGQIRWIEIVSEAGSPLRIINPWKGPVRADDGRVFTGERFEIATATGQTIMLRPA